MKMLFLIFWSLLLIGTMAQENSGPPGKGKPKANIQKEKPMTLEEERNRSEVQIALEEPRISNKWFQGNYLVYDCDKGFFACVNNTSYSLCSSQRTTRIEERNPALGCAPLKRFNTQEECFKVQYQKLHNQMPKLFCIHPNFR